MNTHRENTIRFLKDTGFNKAKLNDLMNSINITKVYVKKETGSVNFVISVGSESFEIVNDGFMCRESVSVHKSLRDLKHYICGVMLYEINKTTGPNIDSHVYLIDFENFLLEETSFDELVKRIRNSMKFFVSKFDKINSNRTLAMDEFVDNIEMIMKKFKVNDKEQFIKDAFATLHVKSILNS